MVEYTLSRIMAVESRRVATTVQQKKWHANINNNNNNNGIVRSSGRKEAKGSTITILDVRTGCTHTHTQTQRKVTADWTVDAQLALETNATS